MSAIGPDLPPHLLAKRKRRLEEDAEIASATASGAKRSPSQEEPDKRRRTVGPAPPPAPLDERPPEPPTPLNDESDDSDDDDFGPALPAENDAAADDDEIDGPQTAKISAPSAEEKLKRDDWMMMPPQQDDLAARMDPTRQRPTGFNTGKGARGPNTGGGDSSTWHETPEQKQKRLQDEMMGISKPSGPGPAAPTTKASKSVREEASNRRIREQMEQSRGPSLLDQHRESKGVEAEDDDPSKRAFDREKDMGSGGRISSSQKREMLNKAAGFQGKFSGGTYL